jgi:predicted Zn-dependent peptidase
MVIAVFGDIESDNVERQLQRSFGAMPAGTSSWPEQITAEPLQGIREGSLAMAKEQALVILGFRGSTYQAADRYPLDVMTAVLSGMAGRLFQSVREAHGLSYTLGAVNVPGWDPGYLLVYAATRPEEQAEVAAVLAQQLQLAAQQGFTEEEVDQAKRYLIGMHRMDLQHLVGLAKRSMLDELYGVGFDAWMSYEPKISAITVSMVNDAAKRYLTMEHRAQILISPNAH